MSGRTITLGHMVELLETLYPLDFAEDWDRVGLVAGVKGEPVRSILLAVDPTLDVARAARDYDLLITHHPLLLKGVHALPADSGKGAVVTELLRSHTALWCGHTNADRAEYGTGRALAEALGMRDVSPLLPPSSPKDALFGLGVLGTVPTTTTAELASRLAEQLPATVQGAKFTGDPDRVVHKVAICPGAGDSFLELVADTDADVYVTSDLRHHTAQDHLERYADPHAVPALIDIPHWASESMWLPLVKKQLEEAAARLGWNLTCTISDLRTDPWTGSCGGYAGVR